MYRVLIGVSMVALLLCVPAAEGKNYAVLISAGQATMDDAAVNSCFWYNPYLQYMALLDEGYTDGDIYFLYGYGTDFNSSYTCYQPPYPVTDYAVSRANIQSVFNTLAGIMTSNDFLYVWWMGHGGPSGGNLSMLIMTTSEYVYDYEIASWTAPIDYDIRSFSWMTCYSGGILDDVENSRTIAMSSATFYESTYDQWLCDTYHAEFHYPERCAWAWETPCGICGPVDADTDNNDRVSFDEAFVYAEANTALSHPQISDLGNLAPITYLGAGGGEPTCDDGIQNQGEDRIDCGGPCPPCDCLSNGECDDGLFCNGAEICDAYGHCQPGKAVTCDDGVSCTWDSCNEETDSCDHVPDDALCDDGAYCNGVETCDVVNDCQPGTDPCPGLLCDEVNDVCIDCLPKGASCTVDEECCSNKCRGAAGKKRCR